MVPIVIALIYQSPPTNPHHRRESFNRALVGASIRPRALGTAQGRALFEALCCEPTEHSWYAQAHLIALVVSKAGE